MILAENYSWDMEEIELYGETKPNSSIRGADASLNFAFAEALQGAIKEGKTRNLKKHLKDLQPTNILYPRFISNHDNGYARAATNYGTEGAKLAYAINALFPGPYLIYYGEELAMRGSRNPPEELRKPVDWKEFSKQVQNPESTLNFYKKIHKIRSNFKDELTSKSMKILEVRTEVGGEVSEDIIAILYEGEEKSLVTIYNLGRNNSAVTITLPQQLKDADTSYELEEVLTISKKPSDKPEFSEQWNKKNPLIIKNLQPKSGIVLKAEKAL
jgi:glycosidase